MHKIQPIYYNAVKHFGKENQLLKCVEEMTELQQAIIKYQLSNIDRSGLLLNLIEEIVDVEIMIKQIKTIFNSDAEVQIYKHCETMKLEKLQTLIS